MTNSTSQVGEVHGLIEGLKIIEHMALFSHTNSDDEFYIITDSEYLFNAMARQWYNSWANNDWLKADGTPLKHADDWQKVHGIMLKLETARVDILPYHIKGHVVSVGKATAKKLIAQDGTLMSLRAFVEDKFKKDVASKPERYARAKEVFMTNHGFLPPEEVFVEMIISNTITDVAAGYYIDKLDADLSR